MKELVHKSTGFTRIEFWAFITVMAFLLFGFLNDGLDGMNANTFNRAGFENAGVRFLYYYHYFIPQLARNIVLFGTTTYLNFILIPKLLLKQSLAKNFMLLAGLFIFFGLVYGVTDTYLSGYLFTGEHSYQDICRHLFFQNYLHAVRIFGIIAAYTFFKYLAIYLIINADDIYARYRFFTTEGIVAFAVWFIILFLLVVFNAPSQAIIGWMSIVLCAILLYLVSFYYFIPKSLRSRHPFLAYVWRYLLTVAILFFPIFIIFAFIFFSEHRATEFSFLNTFFQVFLAMPITWLVYRRKMKGNEEISFLKKELNQSSAKMDFLRSQINPHFLFNALNTLYGTAIQEQAERTGEGIQMLGDMMRFMLQENMQEKISLAREIDYLKNYISLQKLRTDPSPGIDIKTIIQDEVAHHQVAPMLLIPFVENAFKHGISFREPSHIKVGLEIKENTLLFDVYNSRHPKQDNDPEKDKSGVGLQNVQQRLQWLYPNKHELIIRETAKEFFVHLTLQLI